MWQVWKGTKQMLDTINCGDFGDVTDTNYRNLCQQNGNIVCEQSR